MAIQPTAPSDDAPTATTARELVARRIARRAKQFPDLELSALDTTSLDAVDARDLALAGAIDHAVARRWTTLTAVLAPRLRRPWVELEPRLQATLLIGAAQLLLLDRVPTHAAIHTTVEIAKRVVRPGAAGLVNAVLRRVAELRGEIVDETLFERDTLPLGDGRSWRLTAPVFAKDAIERCAQQTAHPIGLLERWIEQHGVDATHAIAAHGLVPAPIIVAGLPVDAPHTSAHETPGFRVYDGAAGSALTDLLRAHPAARVQDPGSAQPVEMTARLAPRLIVDTCAGRGTKTRQLAALHPDARIVATDIDAERRRVLEETFAGDDRVRVVPPAGLADVREQADLVVLDVPCSNTGVLARRVEAKYRFDEPRLAGLVEQQRQIIADALPLLAADGALLYATCSIDRDENEAQIAWLTRWHRLTVVDQALALPRGAPGDPAARYADGGFAALLTRRAG
jgi:16S rRNA (cytosine967-C5)-methyltransferase